MRPSIQRNAKRLRNLALQIIDEIKHAGVTAEELAEGEKNFAQSSPRHADDDARPGVRHRLELATHAESEFQPRLSRRVQKVTLDDIKRVAAHYLTE